MKINMMIQTPKIQEESNVVRIGRVLGSTHGGRLLISAVILTVFAGLAQEMWRNPELSAIVLSAGLAVYGLQLAWRFLPIPEPIHEWWSRTNKAAVGCSAWQYRYLLWIGLVVAVETALRPEAANGKRLNLAAQMVPGILILVGIAGDVLGFRFVRRTTRT